MKTQENGDGDGKEAAGPEVLGEAIPWMPEGWWSPTQCIDRTGRQITVWRAVEDDEKADVYIYIGHGTRAEKVEEGMLVQSLEFVIEAKSFAEASEKYDARLAEVGELVGEEMRKEYTRQKLMLPAGPPPGQEHSGTFHRLNQKPRF